MIMVHCSLIANLLLAALAAPLMPATAQVSTYFAFRGVDYTTCEPGDYPQYATRFGVASTDVVYHDWTLTNLSTGISSTTDRWGPEYGPSEQILSGVVINSVPAGTGPGDILSQHVAVRDVETNALIDEDTIVFDCSTGEPPVEETTAVPGCDALIAIPSTAVGGQFVQTTLTYWTPGQTTYPEVVIEAGKTAWVIGLDATGAYYKVLWACQFLWVPVESMGPNFDEVWNGTPLPTDIVS